MMGVGRGSWGIKARNLNELPMLRARRGRYTFTFGDIGWWRGLLTILVLAVKPKIEQSHWSTVAVAQLVERQVVVLDVAGSSPVGHPFSPTVFYAVQANHSVPGC